MNRYLIPDELVSSIDELDGAFFTKRGIKAVFLDIDNTLVTPCTPRPTKQAERFILSLCEAGLSVCFISNNNKQRVETFNVFGLYTSHYSAKPLPLAYWWFIKKLGIKRREAAAVGDQIYSDILGANLAGIVSVYVPPIAVGGEGTFVQWKRQREQRVVRYLKQCGKYPVRMSDEA